MLSVPVLYLDNTVLYPSTILIAKFRDQKSMNLLNYCAQNDRQIFILLYDEHNKNHSHGTLAKIHKNTLYYNADKTELRVTLEGINKARINKIIQQIPYTIGEIEFEYDLQGQQIITTSELSRLKNELTQWANEQVSSSKDRDAFLKGIDSFTKVVNYSCFLLIKDPELQQLLLEHKTVSERFHLLTNVLFNNREQYQQIIFLNALKDFSEVSKSSISQ